MKVYSIPEEIGPAPDWLADRKGSWREQMDAIAAEEDAHKAALVAWLHANGYGGKNTGKEYRTPVADGHARYMLAENTPGNGGKSILIHLPYGDSWQSPDVEHLPKREILDRIKRAEKVAEIFRKGGS